MIHSTCVSPHVVGRTSSGGPHTSLKSCNAQLSEGADDLTANLVSNVHLRHDMSAERNNVFMWCHDKEDEELKMPAATFSLLFPSRARRPRLGNQVNATRHTSWLSLMQI